MVKKRKRSPVLGASVLQRGQPDSSAGRDGAAGSEQRIERASGQRGSGPAAEFAAPADTGRGCASGQKSAPKAVIAARADCSAARGGNGPLAARPASSAGKMPARAGAGTRTAGTGGRVCHDCGRPTTDYRCEACLGKWRKKHGVVDLDVLEET